MTWPNRRREKEEIILLERSNLWNHGCDEIVNKISPYKEAKWRDRFVKQLNYNILTLLFFKKEQKLDHRTG